MFAQFVIALCTPFAAETCAPIRNVDEIRGGMVVGSDACFLDDFLDLDFEGLGFGDVGGEGVKVERVVKEGDEEGEDISSLG